MKASPRLSPQRAARAVADAIMGHGEQSAKLRGDKMEDVIFSGGDARKPGAACPPQPAFAAAAG